MFPLVCSLRGENVFSYEGDRTREDIVAFAQRLLGPPVKLLNSQDELRNAVGSKETSFVFIGERTGRLWVKFEIYLNICFLS